MSDDTVIAQTINWIRSVVIGCNFCPFAAKAMLQKSIRFVVTPDSNMQTTLEAMATELRFLDENKNIETTLLILPDSFSDFNEYLDLVDVADEMNASLGYEGVYQIASFHPEYLFAGSSQDDPANYTNRSVYPMLHILREQSITNAVAQYPDIEKIPERNINFAHQKGLEFMKGLLTACQAI